MENKRLNDCLKQLTQVIPNAQVLTDAADCTTYGYDNSKMQGQPSAVVFVTSHDEVVHLVKTANQHQIALIPRGRASGTPGGVVPLGGEIVVSFERMNNIIEFCEKDRIIRTQPGVLNETIQQTAASKNLFWPPNPSSAAYCTVGGNLAYNAAGPRAVKYNTTRENTLGLKVVIGTGETITTGTRTTKGVVGYDLTRLLIGSEGTLGMITEATLKLLPSAPIIKTLAFTYNNIHSATDAVIALMSQPTVPYSVELLDDAAVDLIKDSAPLPLADHAKTLLIVEIEGSQQTISHNEQSISQTGKNSGLIDVFIADNEQEKQAVWQTRKSLSQRMREIAPKKINEDIVVPVSNLGRLFDKLRAIHQHYQIPILNFGHAGNGNIHVNMLVDTNNATHQKNQGACLNAIFDTVIDLGGSLSGEHGIGLAKKPYLHKEIDEKGIALMRRIKQQFDPHNILNPGKIFD